jgi:hypothetical protein
VNAPHAFTSMARAMIATGGAIAAATPAVASAPAEKSRRLLAAVG